MSEILQNIKANVRRFIDTLLPLSSERHWSQCGEDALLAHYFSKTMKIPTRLRSLLNRVALRPGFYVDVGAFSPKRLSNTYYFYRKGWRGITIEPNRSSAWMFRLTRPRDIHLACAAGSMPCLVSSDSRFYDGRNKVTQTTQHGSPNNVPLYRLETILDKHLPRNISIELLSIDCEGAELDILKSNNWKKYRPQVICIEDYHFTWPTENPSNSNTYRFLSDNGYKVFGIAGPSILYHQSNARGTLNP